MAAYSRQDVLAALERAVQYGAFSLGAIQRRVRSQKGVTQNVVLVKICERAEANQLG
jgi:hypothetical protein